MAQVASVVDEAVGKYGAKRESLMPVLQYIVQKERFLSEEAMLAVATKLDMASAEVYGVATFYSFLDTKPLGKNIIRICQTIACDMKGKEEIVKAIEKMLKISIGGTTFDNQFSFLATNCIGWCHEGPAMLINDKVYTKLTPEKAVAAVKEHM